MLQIISLLRWISVVCLSTHLKNSCTVHYKCTLCTIDIIVRILLSIHTIFVNGSPLINIISIIIKLLTVLTKITQKHEYIYQKQKVKLNQYGVSAVVYNQIKSVSSMLSHQKEGNFFTVYFKIKFFSFHDSNAIAITTPFFHSINVIDKKPQWYQYFLCGVKGILDALPKDAPLQGFSVVADGIIPPAAGLSSSSALVSAAALATTEVHKVSPVFFVFLVERANCMVAFWVNS